MSKGDLGDKLGTFVKGALAQLDSVREVVVQKSRAGRIQIDVAMMKRRRRDVLAELGRVVAELAGRGRVSEDDFPELGPALAQLEAIDEKIAAEEERARRVAAGGSEAAGGDGEEYYEDADDEDPIEDAADVTLDKDGLDTGSKSG
jgi:hypothetical protein